MASLAPPAVGSTYITTSGGEFFHGTQRVVLPGVGFDASAVWGLTNTNSSKQRFLDPKQQSIYADEIAWLEEIGVKFVRVLGLDAVKIGAIFIVDPKTGSTTLVFDPVKVQALKWFLTELGQAGIRYLIPLHYKRVLSKADLGATPSDLALECVANSWAGQPGEMPPWDLFDQQTLQPLQFQFDQMIAQIVADDPACVGYELENENPVVKTSQWNFNPITKPKLEAARAAAWNAWAITNGVNPAKQDTVSVFRFWASTEVVYHQARIANLRKYAPHALFTSNTFFGDGAYPMLASSMVLGNFISGHFYTGNQQTDTPGFYNGRMGVTPPDVGTRFNAVCKGLKLLDVNGNVMPTIISEYGPQYQSTGNPMDQRPYLAGDMMTSAWTMARSNTNGCNLYSWAINAIWAGGVSAKSGPYDLRNCPEIVEALPGAISVFCNDTYRPVQSVLGPLTNGLYGTTAPGGKVSICGPITDPNNFVSN